MQAGFARISITPEPGGEKIGWIRSIQVKEIKDPIYASAAVLANAGRTLVFIQLDTLSIRWTTVDEIRRRLTAAHGIPGHCVMIAATHNHCGPAVANVGEVRRDDAYVAWLVEQVTAVVAEAVKNQAPAEIGFQHRFEFDLTHNRRTMLRDGTTITHGSGFSHPLALAVEGPIDPEVAVLTARRTADGVILGVIVDFACHPTHHGGGPAITAGYPGVLAGELAAGGCPHLVFLNGACGNISAGRHGAGNPQVDMETIGRRLAEHVLEAIRDTEFESDPELDAALTKIELPYRHITDAEIKGTVRGAQRFIDPKLYDKIMPEFLNRIDERKTQPAEIQVLRTGKTLWSAVPAEFFVQLGLQIKEGSFPLHGLVVSHANGMIGYVPHKEAFARGGYETTFGPAWRLAPEAGDMIVGAALKLVSCFHE